MWRFDDSLHDRSTVAEWSEHFATLAAAVAADGGRCRLTMPAGHHHADPIHYAVDYRTAVIAVGAGVADHPRTDGIAALMTDKPDVDRQAGAADYLRMWALLLGGHYLVKGALASVRRAAGDDSGTLPAQARM